MKKKKSKLELETLVHNSETRKNIPTAEYQSIMDKETQEAIRVAYERRNRDMDPQLVWRGKDNQDWSDLIVQAPPLYIQEKVHPKVLIDDLLKKTQEAETEDQPDLFGDFNGLPDEGAKTEFYQHDSNWTNRMILGDSLSVMASLAEREGLRGKVQCIYIDPPYGIKFNSNFQWSTTNRDVKDGKVDHITREPEQVKAFRDTWRDGIHSYLTYLRDRLTVARDLLTESGSVFVQIGDGNVHRVRALMDEVFGDENFVREIVFKTTSGFKSNYISKTSDYILWYSKNIKECKYNQLFYMKNIAADNISVYKFLKFENGLIRRINTNELLNPNNIPNDSEIFRLDNITSQGKSIFDVYFQGKKYKLKNNLTWKTHEKGMEKLIKSERVSVSGKSLSYVRKLNDFSVNKINEIWSDTITGSFTDEKMYVVQTNIKVIQRCILMSTDPGDIVLDPTCLRKDSVVICHPSFPRPREAGSDVPTHDCCGCGIEKEFSNTTFPVHGGRGEKIQNIIPGNYVIGHDGQPHRVIRTIQKEYKGKMVGIKHCLVDKPLWMTGEHKVLIQKRKVSFGGDRSWKHVPHENFQKAKNLRNNLTLSEKKLWDLLKQEFPDIKFRRQHPIGPYKADFYCRELHLIIEVDGEIHNKVENQAYDKIRDEYLQSSGVKVLRFSNSDVDSLPQTVIEKIRDITENLSIEGKEWIRAEFLQKGDIIYFGEQQQEVEISSIEYEETCETVYDLEVEGCHSYLTDVCMVHNCGSGTTAYVAEQWGRRWITIDTSRVALALARARIMGAKYPFYHLRDSKEGQLKEKEVASGQRLVESDTDYQSPTTHHYSLKQGFVYERVPHITLKSIANNAEIDVIWEKYQEILEPIRDNLNKVLSEHQSLTTNHQSLTTNHQSLTTNHQSQATNHYTEEWEIPREAEEKWSKEAKALHKKWWDARIKRQKEIDASIAAKADFEYLYDRPYEDKKKVRVAGPFTVESLSPHRILGVDENDEMIDPRKREAKDEEGFVKMILDNLLTSGVQQAHKEDRIEFETVKPWPGHYICAEGKYTEGESKKIKRAGIFIGPEFGTVSKPDLTAAAREAGDADFDALISCAFNYDAHSSEFDKLGRLPVLKARMNADLHMGEDLKNTGKGNLFVIFGEPDVEVISGQWLVTSDGKKVVNYELFKELSGIGSVEEINRLGREYLSSIKGLSSGGKIRNNQSNSQSGSVGSEQHSRGGSKTKHEGVSEFSQHSEGLSGGSGNFAHHNTETEDDRKSQVYRDNRASERNRSNALWTQAISAIQDLKKNDFPLKLTTEYYTQATISGVDVFDPTTGEVRSDDTDGIACWFIDTDYNEESFFVRHAYFLGAGDPYKSLKTTLKAEINTEAWETLNSDISRPFPRPKSKRIAVKVINHLGDEVMKVIKV